MTNNCEDERVIDEAEDEVIPFRYSITSYGADYPIDSLVKRIENESIELPSFQRAYVWDRKRASRFVESLLLGLPVPGIFLTKEMNSQKLLVIDGQQRLRTLGFFYKGIFAPDGRTFSLTDVHQQFEGTTYSSLSDEYRRRLDDSLIHAIIVKQDEPSNDESSIYQIFERLNTGGMILSPQEIRASIYHGPFNDLLKELNANRVWRSLYGRVSSRMKDQELILRFFALYFKEKTYAKPMKQFLNNYMADNRYLTSGKDEFAEIFIKTIKVLNQHIGRNVFKPKGTVNSALVEAIMVGAARSIAEETIAITTLRQRYQSLIQDEDFITAYSRATSDELSVHRRIKLAIDAFAG